MWHGRYLAAYQQLCEQLKPTPRQPSPKVSETNEFSESQVERKLICSTCRQLGVDVEMQLVEFQRRPSWRELRAATLAARPLEKFIGLPQTKCHAKAD